MGRIALWSPWAKIRGVGHERNLEIQKCQARCSAYQSGRLKPAGQFGRSLVG